MIDFELTKNDQKILDEVRSRALVCRKYARYYDENEHEFPPDELEEAKGQPEIFSMLGERTERDTSLGALSMLILAVQTWGDYSVRMRRS